VSFTKKAQTRTARAATARSQRSNRRRKPDKSARGKSDVSSYSSVLPGPWQLNAALAFSFILATAVLYAGDLRLGFFRIDDPQYVVNNALIQGATWAHIREILSSSYYLNYSPLHLFSYMLDHAVAGVNAYAFHLSSNLWAGCVAGLVYLVALALTQHRLTAFAAAILFVVHPVHVEAVAWISSRKDLVAAAFLLSSFLAYLKYRQRNAIAWYLASVFLFLLSLLGKLSVAAFPAVLLLFDLFVGKRRLNRSISDKLPFVLLAAFVTLVVQHAQPETGAQPDMSIRAASFIQGIWLLTGLGNYVLYRVPPSSGTPLAQIGGAVFLLALFTLPLLMRRRYPLVTVLIYWILFTYLPTQVLPFSYQVTDRYLFLPSVGAVILIAWLVFKAADFLPKWNASAATALIAVISLLWLNKTVDYLAEWQDPRSVWFAAARKTNDFHVYYELGWEYLNNSAKLGTTVRDVPLPVEQSKRLASVIWKTDPRLADLLSELATNQHTGPTEKAFKEYLQTKASENFDRALAIKGEHLTPDLFLNRGVLSLDKGDLHAAKKELLAGLNEAAQLPSIESRQEALIPCYYNLAVVEQGLGNSKEALSMITLADQLQNQLGRTVITGLSEDRQKLESTITSHDGE
jgi:hypothetical protein